MNVRWADLKSFSAQWRNRAALAAAHIPPCSRVLDLGCGTMALRDFLPPNCVYFPADLYSRSPDCQVVDLNKGEFPTGTYDFITLLGVVEYLTDPQHVLSKALSSAPRMLVTYCTMSEPSLPHRRQMGWVNDLTCYEFESLLSTTGWSITFREKIKSGPGNVQFLWDCCQ